MLSKKEVLKSLKDLPEEFPVDEAIDRLIVLQKNQQGKNGNTARQRIDNRTGKEKIKEMGQLIWAPSALKDIDLIARYISKDSILAAENIVQLFFDKAAVLIKHPGFGKPVPEINDSKLREILVSRYRIIYELGSDHSVHIISVHHQSRLLKNNPVFRKKLK